MRKFFKVLCAASLLCLVANASESLDKIGMTYVKSPLNVPSIVDKFKGFYTKSFGVPVEYSEITSGAKQTQALASNSLQFLNCVGGTSVILAAANKADIKIISAYSRAPEAFVIFSKDQNIKSPKDLKGKKVAGPKGTILNELLVRYLALGGLSINDVEFVSMGIPAAQAALENGSVDMALLAGPAAYNAQKSGLHVVTTGKGVITPVIVTATSGEFYKKHKDVVEKFKKAQDEILAFINANEEEALKLTAQETGLSLEAVKSMYPQYDFSPKITAEDIKALEATQEFMLESKMIEQKIDIKSLLLN